MKHYQEQDSTQTVREALTEYRLDIPGYFDEALVGSVSATFFHRHDLCHVIFGCDTSYLQEGMIDTWTMLGTDVGILNYLRFMRLPEIKQLAKTVDWWEMLRETPRTIVAMVRIYRASRRMTGRWPWQDNTAYMDRRLCDIRRELNIKVLG